MDDDSMSSLSKSLLPTADDVVDPAEADEESGWFTYFEDFLASNTQNNNHHYDNDEVEGRQQQQPDITMSPYFSSSSCDNNYEGGSSSPVVVSDAAFSSAENKCFNALDTQNEKVVVHGYPPLHLERIKTFKKKLSFKKRRKGTLVAGGGGGDDLEDTASSPVNSPKVSYMNQNGMSMSSKDKDHTADILVDQETTTEKRGDGDGRLVLVGGDDNNSSSELKKKGLCLVPLSMLINYVHGLN